MKKLLVAAFACSVLALGACASSGGDKAAGGDSFSKQIEAAKADYKDLAKNEGAWRDTGDMIEEAEKAYADGDKAKAEKMLKKATKQNELARAQWESQKNAGPWYQ